MIVTGTEITLNVFAEFIGGLIYPGNALASTCILFFFTPVKTHAIQTEHVIFYMNSVRLSVSQVLEVL